MNNNIAPTATTTTTNQLLVCSLSLRSRAENQQNKQRANFNLIYINISLVWLKSNNLFMARILRIAHICTTVHKTTAYAKPSIWLCLPHSATATTTTTKKRLLFFMFILTELEILLVQTPFGSFAALWAATNRGRRRHRPHIACTVFFFSLSSHLFSTNFRSTNTFPEWNKTIWGSEQNLCYLYLIKHH